MVDSNRDIKVVIWNIAGFKRQRDVWEFLTGFDIIILQETWIEEKHEKDVLANLDPSYKWHGKAATREAKKGRAKGGQLVGIRNHLLRGINVSEWDYGLIIEKTGRKEKGKIITIYNNVGVSVVRPKISNLVESGIKEDDWMLIAGDWNARIGEEQGKTDTEAEEEQIRISEDKILNAEGKKMLEICEEFGLAVMNGRTVGDEKGNLTYVGAGGSSVLDYVLALENGRRNPVEDLKVLERVESDHMPVMFIVRDSEWEDPDQERRWQDQVQEGEENWKLLWKEEKREEFQNKLQENWKEWKEKNQEEDPVKRMEEMAKIIKKTAKKIGMTKSNRKPAGRKHHDKEYARMKKEARRKLRKFRRAKKEEKENKRRVYVTARTALGNYLKKSAKEWKEKNWKRVEESKTMSDFWEAIGVYRPRRKRRGRRISKESWVNHFKKLLNAEEDSAEIGEGNHEQTEREHGNWEEEEVAEDDFLNRDFGVEEVRQALNKMKSKKAAGEDGITAEFYKNLPAEAMLDLANILNGLWKNGKLGTNWNTAWIYPIYKAGDEEKTANYRGVALLDVEYKLLATILAERLRTWIEKEGKIGESQAGFRKKRGTRDHVFVLNSLIGNRLKRERGRLMAVFVDFKTAFDSIDRDIMLEKVERIGVTGRMLRMIKEIYRDTQNAVITEQGISESFKTKTGVRQGCPLSPILFNIFLEDLDEALIKKKEGGTVIGKTKIFAMKFADDMILLAEEAEGLRQMLKTLEKYVKKNKLEVNASKTKVMVFRKGGKLKKEESWNFSGKELEIVGNYKYLGFWFSTTGTYSRHVRNMAGKAQKASNAGFGVMRRSRIKGLRRRAYLFDTLVKSGFMYGVEVWGWHKTDEWEKLQGRYMKMIMGLDRTTPAYIWRLESGRTQVEVEARRRAGSYLLEIMDMGEERWPKACLLEELRGLENNNPSEWGKEMKVALEEMELDSGQWLRKLKEENDGELQDQLLKGVKRRKEQIMLEDWNKATQSRYCKGYHHWKQGPGAEKYWEKKEVPEKDREQWARMRCGNVGKTGNKGYKNIKCRLCGEKDETLEHIMSCEKLDEFLEDSVRKWRKIWMEGDNGEEKLKEAFKGNVSKEMCDLTRAFEKEARRIATEGTTARKEKEKEVE